MDATESSDPLAEHAGATIVAATPPKTYFAPAGRETLAALRRQRFTLERAQMLKATIDALPSLVLVLNSKRQTISANQVLLDFLGAGLASVLGKRPGELIGCIQVRKGPDGCGTARGCMTCGAVDAILNSQQSEKKCTRECRIILQNGAAMDLRVTATAIDIGLERFTLCTIEDIQDQKRLKVLMRTFFHDALNTASGACGLSKLLADLVPLGSPEGAMAADLNRAVEQLVDEIQSQRDLVNAEAGDLAVVDMPVRTQDLFASLQAVYASYETLRGCILDLKDSWRGEFVTDRRLLRRVLGNLLKNAIDATEPNGHVFLECMEQDDNVVFQVRNSSVMPEAVRLQIFQRSFSTKDEPGRGIGTYSIKLLTERYLGGKVEFQSETPDGTIFSVTIPKVPPRR
jgi:PAS domain-containing protein